MDLHAVQPEREEGWPEAGQRPVVFLLDCSGSLERRLLHQWIERHRPEGAAFQAVEIPPSRRHRRGGLQVSNLLRDTVESKDSLLVPLRVAWLGPRRRGRRHMRLRHLLTFGDLRDPNRLLQEILVRLRPDRVRVVVADHAPASDVRDRWREARASRPDAPYGFAEFVVLQATLSLEVAERRIRGNRYKVPRFLAEDLITRNAFQVGLSRLSERTDEDIEDLFPKVQRYLKEIAATHSTYVIDLIAALIRLVYTQGYDRRIDYDRAELERLAELGQRHSLAFLPSHKSNMDHLALTYVLYENGFPPNHTAGGINMNFFPVGPLLRRAGLFFIRRSFRDNEPYKFVLKQYLDYLLSKRFPLEWFIEGGRSRIGKLREPRFGMLAYVADSYRRGSAEDVVLIPTSIAYDQIQDVGAYAHEQRGGAKEREGFGWMVKAVRSLRRRYGRIYLRFGEPLSIAETLTPYSKGIDPDPDESALEIRKLAFEVAVRINRVTPITPISLVTLALLGNRDRALTVPEVGEALEQFVEYVERRGLPMTEQLMLNEETVTAALDALKDHGVVSRFDGGFQSVYSIGRDQHLAAAYYRNTIIHFFTTAAIAEVALVAAADEKGDSYSAFWEAVSGLRDLLKFEFFFAERQTFREEIAREVEFHDPQWRTALDGTRAEILEVAAAFRPTVAPWVLRPIIEAYHVVADALEARDFRRDVDPKSLVKEALALGNQYRLQGRISSEESVSAVMFQTAVSVAKNRGLLDGGDTEMLDSRKGFAAEVASVLRAIDIVETGATD